MNDVTVEYRFQSNLSGTIITTFNFHKNGCAITKESILERNNDASRVISYDEVDDIVTVTLEQKFNNHTTSICDKDIFSFQKTKASNWLNSVYEFNHIFDISNLMPTDQYIINYKIIVPKNLVLSMARLQGENFSQKDLKTFIDDDHYVIEGNGLNELLPINIIITKSNPLFIILVSIVVLIILLLGIVGYKVVNSTKSNV